MPANLTPQYQKAEEEFRRAQSPAEQVECLQKMLKLIPKHKGTEKLQADLRTRLKEAKSELSAEKKAGKKGRSFKFPRQGAGQVIVIGAPNAGKSRVLAELTNAKPEVALYPFTTHEPMPGMMPWQDAQVQLIDTPPITADHAEPYLLGLLRSADLALLCMDGSSDEAPDVTGDVIEYLTSRKTLPAETTGIDEDDFSVVRIKTLLVVTRGEAPGCEARLVYFRELVHPRFEMMCVEFDRPESKEALRNRIYDMLDVIRVYTKKPGKRPDYQDPYTIPRGGTVEDLAMKVHREMAEHLKYAKVWGEGVHDGQSVGKEHLLDEGNLVELHW